jgi:hypothetical protein
MGMKWHTSDLASFYAMLAAAARDLGTRDSDVTTPPDIVVAAKQARIGLRQRFAITLRFEVLVRPPVFGLLANSCSEDGWLHYLVVDPHGMPSFRGSLGEKVSVAVERVDEVMRRIRDFPGLELREE